MDDCYEEVNSISNIALSPDLNDVLDLDARMEGELPTLDNYIQDRRMEKQCIELQWQMADKAAFTDRSAKVDPATLVKADGAATLASAAALAEADPAASTYGEATAVPAHAEDGAEAVNNATATE